MTKVPPGKIQRCFQFLGFSPDGRFLFRGVDPCVEIQLWDHLLVPSTRMICFRIRGMTVCSTLCRYPPKQAREILRMVINLG